MDCGSQIHGKRREFQHNKLITTKYNINNTWDLSLGSSGSQHLAVYYTLYLNTHPKSGIANNETKFLSTLWVTESEGYIIHKTKK